MIDSRLGDPTFDEDDETMEYNMPAYTIAKGESFLDHFRAYKGAGIEPYIFQSNKKKGCMPKCFISSEYDEKKKVYIVKYDCTACSHKKHGNSYNYPTERTIRDPKMISLKLEGTQFMCIDVDIIHPSKDHEDPDGYYEETYDKIKSDFAPFFYNTCRSVHMTPSGGYHIFVPRIDGYNGTEVYKTDRYIAEVKTRQIVAAPSIYPEDSLAKAEGYKLFTVDLLGGRYKVDKGSAWDIAKVLRLDRSMVSSELNKFFGKGSGSTRCAMPQECVTEPENGIARYIHKFHPDAQLHSSKYIDRESGKSGYSAHEFLTAGIGYCPIRRRYKHVLGTFLENKLTLLATKDEDTTKVEDEIRRLKSLSETHSSNNASLHIYKNADGQTIYYKCHSPTTCISCNCYTCEKNGGKDCDCNSCTEKRTAKTRDNELCHKCQRLFSTKLVLERPVSKNKHVNKVRIQLNSEFIEKLQMPDPMINFESNEYCYTELEKLMRKRYESVEVLLQAIHDYGKYCVCYIDDLDKFLVLYRNGDYHYLNKSCIFPRKFNIASKIISSSQIADYIIDVLPSRGYTEIDPCVSGHSERAINLWRGVVSKNNQAYDPEIDYPKISPMVDFFRRCWFGNVGDDMIFEWFLDFLKILITKPGQNIRTSIFLYSERNQVGKGFGYQFLRNCLGDHLARNVSSLNDIYEKHNEFVGKNRLIMVDELEESAVARKKYVFDKLKSIITADRITINPKYEKAISIRNITSYILASNHRSGMYLDRYDTRYLCLDVSPDLAEIDGYFDDLADKCFNMDTYMAFYRYLMNRDFHSSKICNKAPMTMFKSDLLMEIDNISKVDSMRLFFRHIKSQVESTNRDKKGHITIYMPTEDEENQAVTFKKCKSKASELHTHYKLYCRHYEIREDDIVPKHRFTQLVKKYIKIQKRDLRNGSTYNLLEILV